MATETIVELSVDKSLNLVTFRINSNVTTAAQFMAEYESLLANPLLENGMHSIWDISNLDLTKVPISEIRSLPRAMNQFVARRGQGFRAAIVTQRKVDEVLIKLYVSILRMALGVSLRVFPSNEAAKAWIARR